MDISESFCNWVSYKTLEHFGLHEIYQHIYDNNMFLSTTLKKLQNLEKTGGAKAVMDYVKSAPPGSTFNRQTKSSQERNTKENPNSKY
jgi:hypothetical protein